MLQLLHVHFQCTSAFNQLMFYSLLCGKWKKNTVRFPSCLIYLMSVSMILIELPTVFRFFRIADFFHSDCLGILRPFQHNFGDPFSMCWKKFHVEVFRSKSKRPFIAEGHQNTILRHSLSTSNIHGKDERTYYEFAEWINYGIFLK